MLADFTTVLSKVLGFWDRMVIESLEIVLYPNAVNWDNELQLSCLETSFEINHFLIVSNRCVPVTP